MYKREKPVLWRSRATGRPCRSTRGAPSAKIVYIYIYIHVYIYIYIHT